MTSLAQLMIDPYYRTIDGLMVGVVTSGCGLLRVWSVVGVDREGVASVWAQVQGQVGTPTTSQ